MTRNIFRVRTGCYHNHFMRIAKFVIRCPDRFPKGWQSGLELGGPVEGLDQADAELCNLRRGQLPSLRPPEAHDNPKTDPVGMIRPWSEKSGPLRTIHQLLALHVEVPTPL